MPKFDTKKRYVNTKGQKFGKGVWIDDDGKVIPLGTGHYNNDSKIVTQYNSDGTVSTYSREDWALKQMQDHEFRLLQNDRRYGIPYQEDNIIRISLDENTPTDKNRGAKFSGNLLDSIAYNSKKAGTPFSSSIGIAARESTIGSSKGRRVGDSPLPWFHLIADLPKERNPYAERAKEISYDGVQSPTTLVSNWQQKVQHPFAPFFYDGVTLLKTPRDAVYYDNHFEAALNAANEYRFNYESPLENAFRLGIDRYNSRDKKYRAKVEKEMRELQHSPEIRDYMQKHNLHEEGGSLNSPKLWDDLSMTERAEMMRVAVNNGITDLPTIRQKYNEFAEGGNSDIHIKPENRGKFTALKERTGHSATWFKEHGTPAQKKMATFALNARKWKHADGGPLVTDTVPDDYTYYAGYLPAVTISAPALPAY